MVIADWCLFYEYQYYLSTYILFSYSKQSRHIMENIDKNIQIKGFCKSENKSL